MTGIVEFIAGPLFGLVGGVVTRWQDLEAQKESNRHELKKFDFELQMRDKERIARQEEAEQNMAANQLDVEGKLVLTELQGSWDGLKASIQHDTALDSGYKWVAAVRALMRPALTITGLAALTTGAFIMADGDIQKGTWAALWTNSSMMLAWWFGDRQTEKRYNSRYLKDQ